MNCDASAGVRRESGVRGGDGRRGTRIHGRKTWDPGRTLKTFITAEFGVPAREQADIVEQIGTAMAGTGPQVRAAMIEHPGFAEIGKRMLMAWQEDLAGLRSKRVHAMSSADLGDAFTGFSRPKPGKARREIIGRSDLLGKR